MNREEKMPLPRISLSFLFFFFISHSITVTESKCKKVCDLALASYYAWENTNVTFISEVLHSRHVPKGVADTILEINKEVAGEDGLEALPGSTSPSLVTAPMVNSLATYSNTRLSLVTPTRKSPVCTIPTLPQLSGCCSLLYMKPMLCLIIQD